MGNTVAGNFWRKMTGPRPVRRDESRRNQQSRQSQNTRVRARNSSSINEQLRRPLLQQTNNTGQRPNVKAIQPIQLPHSGRRSSINHRGQQATFERSSIKSHADEIQQQNNPVSPASSVVQPTLPITSNNHIQNQRENRPQVVAQPQEYPKIIQHKMNVYCFKKSRNIIQIHQRHATTCANVLNKGFDSKGDIRELAPNTSLTAIGIQQCMQVSDFLLFCKSKNVNYITSQDYTTIDGLKDVLKPKNSPTQNNVIVSNTLNKNGNKSLSVDELIGKIRLFIKNENENEKTQIEKIIDKLKEETKQGPIITKQKFNVFLEMLNTGWKMNIYDKIINKLRVIDFNSEYHELIQKKELRPMLIFCCSELLRTQQTLFITYFDIIKDYLKNRRKIIVLFWLNEKHFSKMTNADNFVVSLAHTKQQWKYFIKRIKNLEFDKDFIENIGREIGHPELVKFSKKLNLEEALHMSNTFSGTPINYEEWEDIFYVSHHIYPIRDIDTKKRLPDNFSFDNRRFSSGKSNYFVGKKMWDPKEMYRELPEILSKYISDSTIITHDSDYGVDFYEERIGPDVKMNIVFVSHHSSGENTIKYATNEASVAIFKEKQQLMNCELVILPKGGILGIKEYNREFGGVNDDEYKKYVDGEISKKGQSIVNSDLKMMIQSYLNSTNKTKFNYYELIKYFKNARTNLLNELYPSQNAVSPVSPDSADSAAKTKQQISLIENLIMYFEYLYSQNRRNMSQPTLPFTLKNRIFPVGFYDSIITLTVERKNKTEQIRKIYPLFILYNSQLDIFFTPLDVIEQEVAIINPSPQVSNQNTKGINSSAKVSNSSAQNGGGIFGKFKQIFRKKEQSTNITQLHNRTGIESSSQIFSLSSPLQKFLNMTLDEYISFLETSREILDKINKMYNPQQSVPIVQEGVASSAVDPPKGNTYFYNYEKLFQIVDRIKTEISDYNSKQVNAIESIPQLIKNQQGNNQSKALAKKLVENAKKNIPSIKLLDYLRDKFDTKTLVHNFGRCLFDFCAITEPARNKLRQIVREKLKLEIGEKNYAESFQKEVARRLMKFVVDYEKEHGEIKNTNANAKIIPTYNEALYSKKEILEDYDTIKSENTINAEVIKIYSKYFIIDVFAESKILELIRERIQNGTVNNRKKSINAEISRILEPFQKKFMGMLIHKNIRNNVELNVSTQLHRKASNQSFGPSNPFCPMTVRGNKNVLDEIIAFYKAEKVGTYKKKIVKQVHQDYIRVKDGFNIICKNYLKMSDEESIKYYDSYWKIIVDIYGNLNVSFAQNHKLFIYISLFYRYDRLDFFKNIYLITSLIYQFGTSNEFYNFLEKEYKSSKISSNAERTKFDDPSDITYTRIQNILSLGQNGSRGHIIDLIFSYIQLGNYNINDIKENILTILYYILYYNDIYILEFYKKQGYGVLCLFFLTDLPNYILYHDYTNNERLIENYEDPLAESIPPYRGATGFADICKLRNIDYILELSKNKKEYEKKSKIVIEKYLPKYIRYFNENQIKRLHSVNENKNSNKIMKFNEENKKGIFMNGSQNVVDNTPNKNALPEVINKATTLLTQGVYFAT